MPTPGPWIQEPDYDLTVQWGLDKMRDLMQAQLSMAPGERASSGVDEEQVEDGPYPIEPYLRLPDALGGLMAGNHYESWAGAGVNYLNYATGGIYPMVSGAEASWGASLVVVMPGRPTGAPQAINPFWFGPGDSDPAYADWPEGVLEVEYEGDPDGVAQWLTVELMPSTVLYGEHGMDGPNPVTFTASYYTHLGVGTEWVSVNDGIALDEIYTTQLQYSETNTRTLDETYSLTEYMPSGEDPRLFLWMWTPMFIAHADPPEGNGGTWDWSYGWGYNVLHLKWHLHPPRYRFIYEDLPSIEGQQGNVRRRFT